MQSTFYSHFLVQEFHHSQARLHRLNHQLFNLKKKRDDTQLYSNFKFCLQDMLWIRKEDREGYQLLS